MNQISLNKDYYLSDCEGYRQFKTTKAKILSKRLKRILSLAEIRPGMRILDIGCGRGELVLHSGLLGVSFGIDSSEDALKIAYETERFWLRNFPFLSKRILFIKADCQFLPFKDKKIEIVFLSDIVEHLSDDKIRIMLKEVFRVLKEDGKIIIHTSPNRIFLNYGLKFYYFLGRIFGKKLNWNMKEELPLGCKTPIHINEQTTFRLRKTLRKAGFRKIKLWLEKNPFYVYYFLKETIFIKRINLFYRLIPFK
ncbi:MAG: class I SAM-dependent methyltransferase, partial [Candidatus Omnitrophica bacterium]|nr:class I SAM-dependent methyltransferase [Candidatus Omnitrophota bacterium]